MKNQSFSELGVPEVIVSQLRAAGINEPFPIQRATLTDSIDGRDIIGRGRTGSGKTLAFVLPLVTRLAKRDKSGKQEHARPKNPRGLILVPTRELAAQVAATLQPLAKAAGITHVVIHGGVSQAPQVNALHRGVDIVIACPGRLEDLIDQRHCSLGAVDVTVVDEADHMADLGFLPVVKRLLDKTPRTGQRMLFSATLDNGVDVLVDRYLNKPAIHSVDPAESPVPKMEHHVFKVSRDDKPAVVQELASGNERTLLFTRTKHMAKRLALQLSKNGIPAVDLHGNLSQNMRTRNLDLFTTGEVKVLVATDIAARGIHVDDISLVVHVDPPAEHKAFLHRSGRTARAGSEGIVVTLVMPEQRKDVDDLLRRAGIVPEYNVVTPGHDLITELTGPVAPKRFLKLATPAPQQPSKPKKVSQSGRPSRPAGSSRSGKPSSSSKPAHRGQAPAKSRRAGASAGQSSRGQSGRPQSRSRAANTK